MQVRKYLQSVTFQTCPIPFLNYLMKPVRLSENVCSCFPMTCVFLL
jgi:hypothetical protein